MFYDPPQKWTEELIDGLPFGEDDRYERKSGDEISKSKFDDFFNKLAKEIGAFANSFGGTLFIGIADNKKKVGIQGTITRGNIPTERWLENKIPILFELRLQHFRVSRVELTEETQNQIGDDKIIIAIDVFDSELAPHQCVFDHRYYYRSNSESRPAPHHYLAFLWGRANSNMSQVATWWIKDFLKPVIDWLEGVQKNFNQNTFTVHVSWKVFIYVIDFFKREQWDELTSSSVGEYFLSTFPLIGKELSSFEESMNSFLKSLTALEKSIEESPFYLKLLIDRYEIIIKRERIPRTEFEHFNLQEIAPKLLGELRLMISNHPAESKAALVQFTAFSMLELSVDFQVNAVTDAQMLYNFCKEISNELKGKDELVSKSLEEAKLLYEVIKSESITLYEQLKRERMDIAKRYTATFGQ